MSLKPTSKLLAKALPRGEKYAAQYAAPGTVPELVLNKDGSPELYEKRSWAENAAMRAAIELFNLRTVATQKADKVARLTASEFSDLINKINITPTYMAEIINVPQHRVMKWLSGEQDIPHSVHVMVKLIAHSDENFDIAQQITEEAQEKA